MSNSKITTLVLGLSLGFLTLFGLCRSSNHEQSSAEIAARASDDARNSAVQAAGGYLKTDECWPVADQAVTLLGLDPSGTDSVARELRRKVFEGCADSLTFANKDASSVASARKIISCKVSAHNPDAFKACK